MLRLTQNITNTVYLTLSESVTYTATPIYFLFRFISDASHSEVLFTAPDLSTNAVRYNQFNITLTAGTTNYTGGTISLHPDGAWRYEVYEMLSPSNLFLSGTSGTILEKGFVQLSGTPLSYITNSYTGQTTTYSYYEG